MSKQSAWIVQSNYTESIFGNKPFYLLLSEPFQVEDIIIADFRHSPCLQILYVDEFEGTYRHVVRMPHPHISDIYDKKWLIPGTIYYKITAVGEFDTQH